MEKELEKLKEKKNEFVEENEENKIESEKKRKKVSY